MIVYNYCKQKWFDMSVRNVSDSSFVVRNLQDENDNKSETESKAVALAKRELESLGLQFSDRNSTPVIIKPLAYPTVNIALAELSNVQQDMFAFFKTTYETIRSNPELGIIKTCPSLDVFREDAPILEDLLDRWTLDSQLCFFDLLCLDIYADAKHAGADPKELATFCNYSKLLSVELMKSVKISIDAGWFKVIRGLFESVARKMGDKKPANFGLLLKILDHPQQATALGCAPVQWFGRNAVLDGEETRREDVLAMLDFACGMHPKELPFIRTSQSDAEVSKDLCELEKEIVTSVKKSPGNAKQQAERNDLYSRITLLKRIIDTRLLQNKISSQRLYFNIQMASVLFKKSLYKDWIQQVKLQYLGNQFDRKVSRLIAIFEQEINALSNDTGYPAMLHLATSCSSSRPIDALEKEIVQRLDMAKKKYKKKPEIYADFFLDMVCLYQIVHDVNAIKDVTQDQLGGRHIPDSFTERAFVRPIQLEGDDVPLSTEVAVHMPPKSVVEAVVPEPPAALGPAPAPKMQAVAKLEKAGTREEKKMPPAASEQPDFPRKNATGQQVLRLLMNNGFVIRGTSGSHYQMEHVLSHVQTTVPYHHAAVKRGTLASIRGAFCRALGCAE